MALIDTVLEDFATLKADLTTAIDGATAAIAALKAEVAGNPDLTPQLTALDASIQSAAAAVKAFNTPAAPPAAPPADIPPAA